MSCAVPCVVTNVGAAAWVVGETGRCVPTRDPDAFAQAIADLIDAGPAIRNDLGKQARDRIVARFALEAVVKQYENLYVQVHDEVVRYRRAQ
jgi:glycosyltransferase involved in cell wall biosynthesis